MGEHLPCKQGVKSSNLSISMTCHKEEPASGRIPYDLRRRQRTKFVYKCVCYYVRCRYATGKHPYPYRTRRLSRRRPKVLCRRQHGRTGGCRTFVGNNERCCFEQDASKLACKGIKRRRKSATKHMREARSAKRMASRVYYKRRSDYERKKRLAP